MLGVYVPNLGSNFASFYFGCLDWVFLEGEGPGGGDNMWFHHETSPRSELVCVGTGVALLDLLLFPAL